MTEEKPQIGPGTKFRYHYADSNPLWEVKKRRGPDAWECAVAATEPDYAGSKRVFGTEEIERAISAESFWDGLRSANHDFWSSLEPGRVIHYQNYRDSYVRCVAVRGLDSDGNPAVVARPVALVGNWRDHDLPRWIDAGWFSEGGYHARKVAEGETMQPNEGSVWESPDSVPRRRGDPDPTGMEPIDLSHPEPTPEQAEAARLLAVVNGLREALKVPEGGSDDWPATYRAMLEAAGERVAAYRDEEAERRAGPSGPGR